MEPNMSEPKNQDQSTADVRENAPAQKPAPAAKRRIPTAPPVGVVASFDTTAGIKNYSGDDDDETP